jgi:hypothetical protein
MPPAYVKTIREEILYEYAKLISRSAYETLEIGMFPHFKKFLNYLHYNGLSKILSIS